MKKRASRPSIKKAPEPQRLSKLLSERGICSRREADRYIEAGLVKVDGEIVSELGSKALPNAVIELLPKAKQLQENKITILLNKPIGYVSTQPEKDYPEAIELITQRNQYRSGKSMPFNPGHLRKLSVVGRLDIDSKGLLLFTQDGALAKKLIGEDSEIEKEYIVRVEGDTSPATIRKLAHGLSLDKKKLKPVQVELLEPGLLKFILKEGRKRQIRRMCDQVKLRVIGLKRVRIDRFVLGDLPEGKWRYI